MSPGCSGQLWIDPLTRWTRRCIFNGIILTRIDWLIELAEVICFLVLALDLACQPPGSTCLTRSPHTPTRIPNGMFNSFALRLWQRAPWMLSQACRLALAAELHPPLPTQPTTGVTYHPAKLAPASPLRPSARRFALHPVPCQLHGRRCASLAGRCSTTMTVFPTSRSVFNALNNASTSAGSDCASVRPAVRSATSAHYRANSPAGCAALPQRDSVPAVRSRFNITQPNLD